MHLSSPCTFLHRPEANRTCMPTLPGLTHFLPFNRNGGKFGTGGIVWRTIMKWGSSERDMPNYVFVRQQGLLDAAVKDKDSMKVWTPVILQQTRWPNMHIVLRCALSLTVSSVECERLISSINRINRQSSPSPPHSPLH